MNNITEIVYEGQGNFKVTHTKKTYYGMFLLTFPGYTEHIGTIANKNKVSFDIFKFLLTSCYSDNGQFKQWSPFVEVNQAELARQLKTSPQIILRAIKILLEFDLVIKVNSNLFYVNLKYVTRNGGAVRIAILNYLEKHSLEDLHILYQTGKIVNLTNKETKPC